MIKRQSLQRASSQFRWRIALFNFVHYELLLRWRQRDQFAQALGFFILLIIFFPLAFGANAKQLTELAPGLLWLAALLAILLSLEQLFKADFQDGTLTQLWLSELPFYLVIFIKIGVHWCVTGLLLVVMMPILALMLSMSLYLMLVTMLSLFVGTLALCLFGAFAAALTVNLKRGNALSAIITLPFNVPILIFGVACTQRAAMQNLWLPIFALLAAITLLAILILPWACASALRLNLQS